METELDSHARLKKESFDKARCLALPGGSESTAHFSMTLGIERTRVLGVLFIRSAKKLTNTVNMTTELIQYNLQYQLK